MKIIHIKYTIMSSANTTIMYNLSISYQGTDFKCQKKNFCKKEVNSMIPFILVRQLEKGLNDYIETTFPMTNAPFKGSLSSMLNLAGESTGAYLLCRYFCYYGLRE